MRDPVYTAELDHDRGELTGNTRKGEIMGSVEFDERENDRGELTDKMIEHALSDLIYRLFDGQKVNGWTLRGFLTEQDDIDELAYRIITGWPSDVRTEIEGRLREYLENTDTLIEHANNLANEEE